MGGKPTRIWRMGASTIIYLPLGKGASEVITSDPDLATSNTPACMAITASHCLSPPGYCDRSHGLATFVWSFVLNERGQASMISSHVFVIPIGRCSIKPFQHACISDKKSARD